ncbi:hypothetical protein [Mycolicibacterium thermoresistibile]
MTRHSMIVVSMAVLAAGIMGIAPAPVAHATEMVTYEVVSDSLSAADHIEYYDGSARRQLTNVRLPWRTTLPLANPRSLGTDGAEVRADWRSTIAGPVWRPGTWVTVRIYIGDTLRCQSTLDIGNAACYGSTGFTS